MGNVFSRKKKSAVTEQDKAVLQLKTTRDKIWQYQKRAEFTLEKDKKIAKELLKNEKKERAKLLLQKKRFIEEQLRKTDIQLENLEKMIQDLEFSQIELKVIDCLKVGNEALKQVNEIMSIENIEQILDETQEAMEIQQEITALLSGNLSNEDEGAVDAELNEILESIVKQLPEVPETTKEELILPEVPGEEPREKVKEKPLKEKIAIEAS